MTKTFSMTSPQLSWLRTCTLTLWSPVKVVLPTLYKEFSPADPKMLNCFDFCLTVSRSIVDFLCTDQDTVALWEVHQRIKDYPSKQDQSNFQKTEWCKQKYLLHENSTGKADRLANGGHHQAVIHPCPFKPGIQFYFSKVAFLLSYLAKVSRKGWLWPLVEGMYILQ